MESSIARGSARSERATATPVISDAEYAERASAARCRWRNTLERALREIWGIHGMVLISDLYSRYRLRAQTASGRGGRAQQRYAKTVGE